MLKENLNQEVKLINYGEDFSDYSLTKSVIKTTIGEVLKRFNIELLTKEELLERNRATFEIYHNICPETHDDVEDYCITKYMCGKLDTKEWLTVSDCYFAYRVNEKFIKDINKMLITCEGMVFPLSGRKPKYMIAW